MPAKLISFILLFCLGLGLFIHYQSRAPLRGFSDYRVYHNAGKDILSGKNIYVRPSEEITPFKYSPLFAVFMAPFAIFDKRISASLFFLLNLSCLFFSFWLSSKLIFLDKVAFKQGFWIFVAVLMLSFRAILHCLDSGQVGLLISFLCLLGLFYISKSKQLKGSFLISFAGMIKYMPFIFGVYFFLRRKFKIVYLMGLSFLIYCLIPAVFLGFKTNFTYLKEWIPYITSTSLGRGSFLDPKNHSLWVISQRLLSCFGAGSFTVLFTVCLFAVAVFLFTFRKKTKNYKINQLCDCADYGMIFLSTVLFNPNAWLHNYSVLIFPYMLIVYYLFICNFKDKLVLIFLFFSFILFSLGSESLVGEKMKIVLENYSLVTWGVLFVFAAIIKIKFFSRVKLIEA